MPRQYSSEFRQRAVHLVDTTMEAPEVSGYEAIKSVASKLGVSEEPVRAADDRGGHRQAAVLVAIARERLTAAPRPSRHGLLPGE